MSKCSDERPNVALALTPTEEWSERYRRALRLLCPQADAEALNPDNDLAMQSRMMGDRPEVCARYVADEIIAWSSPNAEVSESGDENQKP